MSIRPTINHVKKICSTLIGTKYSLPKSKNKGAVGILLEKITGIPTSSSCWDCISGEVKAFPLKRLKDGKIVPKETVAITMMKPEDLESQSWEETRLFKKIQNLLFVAYIRDGDDITFVDTYHIEKSDGNYTELYHGFKTDYTKIQKIWNDTKTITGKTGIYIQSRTKGAGGNTPKTRAYYFKKAVLDEIQSKKPIKID